MAKVVATTIDAICLPQVFFHTRPDCRSQVIEPWLTVAPIPMDEVMQSTRRRIRVAHVVLQLDTGGMEKLLVEFARHADRERFDLRFLCISTRGRLADEIEAQGWTVVSMNEPPGLRA